jgi:Flp pilus assembly protein TadG
MLDASINGQIRAAANRFAKANQGNITVIFAIALVSLLSFIGAAIDYSRANAARSSMQAALDPTASMVSKDLSQGMITPHEITAKAQAYSTHSIPTGIILLSDGLNMQDRWYTDAASIDMRQKILCKNARDARITIYAMQVNTSKPVDPTSTVLSDSASGPENFHMLTSATQGDLRLQLDRNVAVEVARREVIPANSNRKKARPNGRAF